PHVAALSDLAPILRITPQIAVTVWTPLVQDVSSQQQSNGPGGTRMAVNQQQREQWNDENQATLWPKRERITTCVTRPLLDLLALQPGERVLEIGSGGGLAAIEAANAVAPSGEVVGFDLSAPLVNLATNRAAEAGVP